MKAFQSAISKRDEKTAALVKVSANTTSVSKAPVCEDGGEPKTNLKAVIGTGAGIDCNERARPQWKRFHILPSVTALLLP